MLHSVFAAALLKGISESQESITATEKQKKNIAAENNIEETTPEESFENAYIKVRQEVEQELLQNILNNSPDFLERLVVDLGRR